MFEFIVEIAKNRLVTSGSHSPTIVFVREEQVCNVPFDIPGDDIGRDIAREVLQNLIYMNKVDSYVLITENWMRSLNKNETFETAIKSENKKQVLMIHEFSKDMNNRMAMMEFTKDARGKIYIEKEVKENDVKDVQSFWNIFLEKEGYVERERKIVHEQNDKFLKHLSTEFHNEFYGKFLDKDYSRKQLKEEIINWIKNKKKKVSGSRL